MNKTDKPRKDRIKKARKEMEESIEQMPPENLHADPKGVFEAILQRAVDVAEPPEQKEIEGRKVKWLRGA